jgi:hypothetical protein
MKYELLAAAILLLVGTQGVAANDETIVAEGEDVHHYWAADEGNDETYDGTGDITIVPDDNWEAGAPYGNYWDPNEESTREGSDLGGNDFVLPELGDEIVTGPAVMEIFEGRDVRDSLATEHGRGGGARGHARGRGRPDEGTRNLRGKQN